MITATVHPSSILRAPDDARRHSEMQRFVADLKTIAPALRSHDRHESIAPDRAYTDWRAPPLTESGLSDTDGHGRLYSDPIDELVGPFVLRDEVVNVRTI